jgi:hypothetical protein
VTRLLLKEGFDALEQLVTGYSFHGAMLLDQTQWHIPAQPNSVLSLMKRRKGGLASFTWMTVKDVED